ncbi:hypothetical protein LXL04_031972 [Taraxacum kok-saghyz]
MQSVARRGTPQRCLLQSLKTSTVCGPHLQPSTVEEVDQTSAVCKKKTRSVKMPMDEEATIGCGILSNNIHHYLKAWFKRCDDGKMIPIAVKFNT